MKESIFVIWDGKVLKQKKSHRPNPQGKTIDEFDYIQMRISWAKFNTKRR